MSTQEVARSLPWPTSKLEAKNLVAGEWSARGAFREIRSPYNNAVLGSLFDATETEVESAIVAAGEAFNRWRLVPLKERCTKLFALRDLLIRDLEALSVSAALESGKTVAEGRAEALKAIEVLEFATSLQNSDQGGVLEVSRGVSCEYRREPLGITLGITPFNFPAMVPMWMIPISLAVGNAFILKPSDKVPFTPCLIGNLAREAGLPAGLFSVLQGGRELVEKLVTHPRIEAIGFVGSSAVASDVYARAAKRGRRALCLGGAKNHLIITPDADPAITVEGVVASFTGCAGQRCMAASVFIAVGDVDHIIDQVIASASRIKLGEDMGALIDGAACARLRAAIERATQSGAVLRLDGRKSELPVGCEAGNWLGPTVIDNASEEMECACVELFGPVLTIIRVKTVDEALRLEAKSAYGNALSIFTSSGHVARYVADRATSGMVGINIGVPVPREPFSFGGTKTSKFGSTDITGWGGVEHWSNRKKITTKWSAQVDRNWMS